MKELGEKFDPIMGRPSTELYSIAGLLLIMEFKNWMVEEAPENPTAKQQRLQTRWAEKETDTWRERYRIRPALAFS